MMQRRLSVPFFFLLVSASLLCAQTSPLGLCIVQTKPDQATEYDPPEGPWAIAIHEQLSGKKLNNGSPLAITVLPASLQKEILAEAQRPQCGWVLQVSDLGLGLWSDPNRAVDPQGDLRRGSLFFSLWNRETHKTIAQGAPRYGATWHPKPNSVPELDSTAAALAQQVLTSLNKLH